MSDTARTNDLDAATRAIAARKLYDRAVRTFIDGDPRVRTALKRRRRAGRRAAPRGYPTRSARPRRGETREEQVARLQLELAAMKGSSH